MMAFRMSVEQTGVESTWSSLPPRTKVNASTAAQRGSGKMKFELSTVASRGSKGISGTGSSSAPRPARPARASGIIGAARPGIVRPSTCPSFHPILAITRSAKAPYCDEAAVESAGAGSGAVAARLADGWSRSSSSRPRLCVWADCASGAASTGGLSSSAVSMRLLLSSLVSSRGRLLMIRNRIAVASRCIIKKGDAHHYGWPAKDLPFHCRLFGCFLFCRMDEVPRLVNCKLVLEIGADLKGWKIVNKRPHFDKPTTATPIPNSSDDKSAKKHKANENECWRCRKGGRLICCDNCPKAFHLFCVTPVLNEIPAGDWYCEECIRQGPNQDQGDEPPARRLGLPVSATSTHVPLSGGSTAPKQTPLAQVKQVAAKDAQVCMLIHMKDMMLDPTTEAMTNIQRAAHLRALVMQSNWNIPIETLEPVCALMVRGDATSVIQSLLNKRLEEIRTQQPPATVLPPSTTVASKSATATTATTVPASVRSTAPSSVTATTTSAATPSAQAVRPVAASSAPAVSTTRPAASPSIVAVTAARPVATPSAVAVTAASVATPSVVAVASTRPVATPSTVAVSSTRPAASPSAVAVRTAAATTTSAPSKTSAPVTATSAAVSVAPAVRIPPPVTVSASAVAASALATSTLAAMTPAALVMMNIDPASVPKPVPVSKRVLPGKSDGVHAKPRVRPKRILTDSESDTPSDDSDESPKPKRTATGPQSSDGDAYMANTFTADSSPADDKNFDICTCCGQRGDLLCCDDCPASYHDRCCNPVVKNPPEGDWFCDLCRAARNMTIAGGPTRPTAEPLRSLDSSADRISNHQRRIRRADPLLRVFGSVQERARADADSLMAFVQFVVRQDFAARVPDVAQAIIAAQKLFEWLQETCPGQLATAFSMFKISASPLPTHVDWRAFKSSCDIRNIHFTLCPERVMDEICEAAAAQAAAQPAEAGALATEPTRQRSHLATTPEQPLASAADAVVPVISPTATVPEPATPPQPTADQRERPTAAAFGAVDEDDGAQRASLVHPQAVSATTRPLAQATQGAPELDLASIFPPKTFELMEALNGATSAMTEQELTVRQGLSEKWNVIVKRRQQEEVQLLSLTRQISANNTALAQAGVNSAAAVQLRRTLSEQRASELAIHINRTKTQRDMQTLLQSLQQLWKTHRRRLKALARANAERTAPLGSTADAAFVPVPTVSTQPPQPLQPSASVVQLPPTASTAVPTARAAQVPAVATTPVTPNLPSARSVKPTTAKSVKTNANATISSPVTAAARPVAAAVKTEADAAMLHGDLALLNILRHAVRGPGGLRVFATVSLVSRRWRKMAALAVETLDLLQEVDLTHAVKLACRLRALKSLKLNNLSASLSNSLLATLAGSCTQLVQLHIEAVLDDSAQQPVIDAGFAALAQSCQLLFDLKIMNLCTTNAGLRALSDSKSLRLLQLHFSAECTSTVDDDGIALLVGGLKHLLKLHLTGRQFSAAALSFIGLFCGPELLDLDTSCFSAASRDIAVMIGRFRNLSSLILPAQLEARDDLLASITQLGGSLRSVRTLTNCRVSLLPRLFTACSLLSDIAIDSVHVDDIAIQEMVARCPLLARVALRNAEQLTALSMQMLRKLTGLTELELTGCALIDDDALRVFLDQPRPQLISLILTGTKVTDESCYVIACNCPNLAQLSLPNSDDVSDAGIRAILQQCLLLHHLSVASVHITGASAALMASAPSLRSLRLANLCVSVPLINALARAVPSGQPLFVTKDGILSAVLSLTQLIALNASRNMATSAASVPPAAYATASAPSTPAAVAPAPTPVPARTPGGGRVVLFAEMPVLPAVIPAQPTTADATPMETEVYQPSDVLSVTSELDLNVDA
eukprot:TRINITY_DN1562_c0_g1_i1.p1 TRINITY_DN1562_c0_g1~~TRINITY_DN1562_c0_g1_i1.p1  ORF type:complete len:1856 (-),score=360.00 TRINITY_DN1562_c0_g1_i1:8-5575(-)